MIPCVGIFAIIPAVISLIMGMLAFTKARDNGDPKTLSFFAIGSSIIAIGLAIFWFVTVKNVTDDIKDVNDIKITSTNCDSIRIEINEKKAIIAQFEEDLENKNDVGLLSKMKEISITAATLEKLNERAIELRCFDDNKSSIDSSNVEDFME